MIAQSKNPILTKTFFLWFYITKIKKTLICKYKKIHANFIVNKLFYNNMKDNNIIIT